jgi:hypothetical protein
MALVVAFRNLSELAEVSDYEVTVFVNEHCIDRHKVTGHTRSDGYLALVKRFVEQVEGGEARRPTGRSSDR